MYLDNNFTWTQRFLGEHLPKASFRIPDATYLAWIDMRAYFDESVNLTRFFLEKAGVILEGGEMFVENGNCRVRLNLACPRVQLQKALEKIRDAIVGLHENRNITRGSHPLNQLS